MINNLITWSLRNRIIVLLFAAAVAVYGVFAVKTTAVDAIPDLSENQVIIFTEWMGRGPQIIEDQITYAGEQPAGYSEGEEHPGEQHVRDELRVRDIR